MVIFLNDIPMCCNNSDTNRDTLKNLHKHCPRATMRKPPSASSSHCHGFWRGVWASPSPPPRPLDLQKADWGLQQIPSLNYPGKFREKVGIHPVGHPPSWWALSSYFKFSRKKPDRLIYRIMAFSKIHWILDPEELETVGLGRY